MKKVLMTGLVLAMVGVTSVAAFSWGPGYHRGGYGGYGPGPGPCWTDYDRQSLTEEQAATMDELESKHFNETRKLRRDLWTRADKLDELMSSENPDRNEVMSLQKEISNLRDQLQEKNLDYSLEVKKIVPDADTRRGGYGMRRGGYGMGPGRGAGRGQGGGPGYGYCWR